MKRVNDNVEVRQLAISSYNKLLKPAAGLTIRRMVKYGQTPFSCPYFLTSSRVYTPGGIKFPGS